MCGVHFIQSQNGQCEQWIESFVLNSTHRGPNGKGFFSGKINELNFSLGHNLLAVNDFVEQPLSKNERYFLSYNGEIYNYLELAQKHKVELKTNDSEVLFELLIQFGAEILPQLNGMFAFVFVDKERGESIIARDYFGQKPLYYSQNEESFFVSSELRNLKTVDSKISRDSILQVLNFKYTKDTCFDNIKTVEAASYLVLKADNSFTSHHYSLDQNNKLTLKEAISSSVSAHSKGDIRPAVLLSGGLDSSIILRELVLQNRNPIAYTLDTLNESEDLFHAKKLCEDLNVEHRIIAPSITDFEQFIDSIDQPVGDGAFYFQWLLAREISKEHRFALCGNGADELFGGYRRHQAFKQYLRYKPLFLSLKSLFGKAFKNNASLEKFFSNIDQNAQQTFINFSKNRFDLEAPIHVKKDVFTLNEALNFDIENYLEQDVLKITDQSAMAFGLEYRSPFLDSAIFALSSELEAKEKIKNKGKFHLKELYKKDALLQEILKRKKQGFGIPFTDYWSDTMKFDLLDLTIAIDSYITKKELEHIHKMIYSWNNKWSNEYWTILILCKWLQLNK